MFILAKRNILLPGKEPGAAPVRLKKDLFATVPDSAADTNYFRELVADGKIVVTNHSDKAIQTAAEKPVKTRRGKAAEAAYAESAAPAPEQT